MWNKPAIIIQSLQKTKKVSISKQRRPTIFMPNEDMYPVGALYPNVS